jgi:hypothetical protein
LQEKKSSDDRYGTAIAGIKVDLKILQRINKRPRKPEECFNQSIYYFID